MRFPTFRPFAAAALLAAASALPAQRVLGPDADAVTIPRGMLRIGIGGEHTLWRDRWHDGRVEALGAGFSLDPLGARDLDALGDLERAVRDLGVPDFGASLGRTRLDLRQRMYVTPVSVEYGLTRWLTLGVTAPLVRVRAEALFRLDGGMATLGVNPYFLGSAVPAANRTVIDAYAGATQSLQTRRAECIANVGAHPECGLILAEATAVDALIGATGNFATRLGTVFGGDGLPTPSRYVPLDGSATEQAMFAFADSLRGLLERYGVATLGASAPLPLGAQAPLAADDLDALVGDATAGFGARPLTGSARIGLGDIDVTAKLRLLDTFGGDDPARLGAAAIGLRQAVGVILRVGSGVRGDPGDFLDLGTGSGEHALGIRSYTDVVVNSRLWTSVVLGWARAQPSSPMRMRVPAYAGQQLIPVWRERDVTVTSRGAVLQAEVTPRLHLSDYFAIGAYWGWRRRGEDRFDLDALTGPLGGIAVAPVTAFDEQRAGFSLSYSTVAAHADGRVRRPFEIHYTHRQSIASGEGIVPRAWEDRVQLRYYARLFGR